MDGVTDEEAKEIAGALSKLLAGQQFGDRITVEVTTLLINQI